MQPFLNHFCCLVVKVPPLSPSLPYNPASGKRGKQNGASPDPDTPFGPHGWQSGNSQNTTCPSALWVFVFPGPGFCRLLRLGGLWDFQPANNKSPVIWGLVLIEITCKRFPIEGTSQKWETAFIFCKTSRSFQFHMGGLVFGVLSPFLHRGRSRDLDWMPPLVL